jgi:hypothetical protein
MDVDVAILSIPHTAHPHIQLFRVYRIIEKCLKFLFKMSKWKFCYSIIQSSTRFSEDPFKKPAK